MFPLIGPEMIEAWACRPKECREPSAQLEASRCDGEAAVVSYARVTITRRPLLSLFFDLKWIARNRLFRRFSNRIDC
jgi:hypothetical protein